MKVITIKQPFATLIVEGLKEYEFRSWKTKYRGEILIHAGKSVDTKAMERFSSLGLDYPSGCIIGKAIVTDCILVTEEFRSYLKKKDPLVYYGVINDKMDYGDKYGFKLEKVEKTVKIDSKGQLGLWNYDMGE